MSEYFDAADIAIAVEEKEMEMNKEQCYKAHASCVSCKHYHSHKETESWEMPHIFWYERSCDARPTIANLVQFPFENTSCQQYVSRNTLPAPALSVIFSDAHEVVE